MGSEENGEAQYNIRRQKLKKNQKFQYCDPLKYLHASRLSTPDPIHIDSIVTNTTVTFFLLPGKKSIEFGGLMRRCRQGTGGKLQYMYMYSQKSQICMTDAG